MEHTRKILLLCFWAVVVDALLLVLFFEVLDGLLEFGVTGALGGRGQTEFWILTLMELLTPLCMVVALRLVKFSKVSNDLRNRGSQALLQWGIVRLLLLEVPLLLNVLFYYLTLTSSFGYLAIITAICLPFVYPSLDRCLTEVEL